MFKILHISDLHFGPPYLEKVGDALLRATAHWTPDVIVASGDFTQNCKPEEFQSARAFLDRLPDVPRVVTPGNHDVPRIFRFWEWTDPFALYRRHIYEQLNYSMRLPGISIMSVNTTSRVGTLRNGSIRLEQLQMCEDFFRDTPQGDLKMVVGHHHLAPAPDYKGGSTMRNAERAVEKFTELRVDLVLGGHLHRAFIGNSLDFAATGNRDHGVTIIQCGTSTSRRGRVREREKNSFNLIFAGPKVIRVTQFMYFSEPDAFHVVSERFFPRASTSWLERDPESTSFHEEVGEVSLETIGQPAE